MTARSMTGSQLPAEASPCSKSARRCLATLQDRFRRHGGKQMHCPSDDTRPAGLMVGTQPRSVLPGVCLGHELLCQMTNDVTR